MKRLAILSTHPIQYNAPLFRMLHDDEDIELHVFFSKTWEQVKFDPDFQREVVWDTPVSEGYPHSTRDASSKSGKQDLMQAIREFNPDALLVYGWNFPGHLATMRKFQGSVPIWFRGDSHLLDPLPLWKKLARRTFLSWLYRHIDFAFSVGTANEAYYRWCGLKPSQYLRAPHAVDNAFFNENHEQHMVTANSRRLELGIQEDEAVVLFAGKLEPKKQPSMLIKAWSKINNPNCHIIIAGSGIMEPQLKSHWNSHPRVHFLGFQNQKDMPVIYRMADIYCLPSKGPGETWGLGVNEAMACGTPCAVSDRAGCSLDMFDSPAHGAVVPWNQPDKWTQTIEAILEEKKPSLHQTNINKRFNINEFFKALKSHLQQLD